MIDQLSLTINITPDREYLDIHGILVEDRYRSWLYKYMYLFDKAKVYVQPHKFNEFGNARIPFAKIDINPKYFDSFECMKAYILGMFEQDALSLDDFNVSRIDIAVDKENFPIDILLSIMRVNKARTDSIHFFKGTLYVGSDPKVRIYDKVKEILSRVKEGKEITAYEKSLLESGNSYTRFEVQIRGAKRTFQSVVDNPASFASYYDRLEFFNFKDNIDSGVLQVLYKYINRKFRTELDKYKDHSIVPEIKDRYISSVTEWFKPAPEPF